MKRYLIPALMGALMCQGAMAQTAGTTAEAPAAPASVAPAAAAEDEGGEKAPERAHRWGRRGGGGPLKRLAAALDLTAEQKRSLLAAGLKRGPELVLGGGGLKASHARISSALMAATLDRAKIDAELQSLEAAGGKLTESAADAVVELVTLLTPEQRQKLAEIVISRGRGHFGGGRDGGHGRMGRMGGGGFGGGPFGRGPGGGGDEDGDGSDEKDAPWNPRKDLSADQRSALHRAHLAARAQHIENRAAMMAGGMKLAAVLLEATPTREAVLGALQEIAAACLAKEKQRVESFTQGRQILGEESFARLVSSRRPEKVLRMLGGGGPGGMRKHGPMGRQGRRGREHREMRGGGGGGERGGGGRLDRRGREGGRPGMERFREMRERWQRRREERRDDEDRDRRRFNTDRDDRDDPDRDEADRDDRGDAGREDDDDRDAEIDEADSETL